VTRADQALALVEGGLGLTIVDNFATTGSALIIRPLRERIEMTAHFVYLRLCIAIAECELVHASSV
jgi:hypothetical protein